MAQAPHAIAQASHAIDRKRVKVYELRENDWFDRGTGFCAPQAIFEDARILVESEDEPNRILLEVRVKRDDTYQKQQDTLIVWTDPEGVDMALSFQEAEGCTTVWISINEVQQKVSEDEDIPPGPLNLPPAELGNLPHIEMMVRRANATQPGRDALAKMILAEDYISALVQLLPVAEDLEDLPDLHRLCNIMKTLILLNETPIIEQVVRDDIILGVVGALEYDPDFPRHKANHRQYLSEYSKFKEVVPFEDLDIKRKIHSTYRLQYLKDVVLARILDDPTFGVLNSLIFFHQVDIVSHVQTDQVFLQKLFAIITSPDEPNEKKKDAVLFVQTCCAIAKNLQHAARSTMFANLISSGLFQMIDYASQHKDSAVRVAGTDVFVAVIDHDAQMMRSHIIKSINEKTKPMTDNLIETLLVETDLGVKAQIADAIKVLLDPNSNAPIAERPMGADPQSYSIKMRNNMTNGGQADQFLQYFYEHSARVLFQPIQNLEKRESMTDMTFNEISTLSHLVEILCFFMRQHNYRSKYFILSEGIHSRIAQLLRVPQKHLKLTAIKYFRTAISIHDQFHTRQIITLDLLAPVLDILFETMPRDNLLNSACLELFEWIRRENVRILVDYLVERHRERLQSITYVEVFNGILLRHEQWQITDAQVRNGDDSSFATSEADTPNTRHVMINGGGGRWQGLKETDAEEDAYFNAEDNEEDEIAINNSEGFSFSRKVNVRKPLVDYVDDDDDDDDDNEEEELQEDILESTSSPSELSPPNQEKDSIVSSLITNPSQAPPSTPPSTPPPAPPQKLAEKRRREEDEEDELGKLSTGVKRRNSTTSSNTNGIAVESDKMSDKESSPGPIDSENGKANMTKEKPELRQSLRRSKGQPATGAKKIAIAFGSAAKKE